MVGMIAAGMGLRTLLKALFRGEPNELFRRYFVNTLFDSTFVVLGILAASAFIPDGKADVVLGAIFAACLAIGISTGVSVYEAEHTEDEIRLNRLERAMLSPLRETEVGEGLRGSRFATSFVNFLAPLAVAAVTGTPILLLKAGIVAELVTAATISSALAIALIFATGYYLGTLTGRRPWRKAVRMSIIAILTFGGLLLLDRLL